MRKHRLLPFALGLLALLGLSGRSDGGSCFPPPGDSLPDWSTDGSSIAFFTQREGPKLKTVSERFDETTLSDALDPYPGPNGFALSPNWRWIAFLRHEGGDAYVLTAFRVDGSEERDLARASVSSYGTRPTWSPDSERIAFREPGGAIAVVGRDGEGLTRITTQGETPSWSPDGTRIAYARIASEAGIHVVEADGHADALVAGGFSAQFEPKWSPDGAHIAFHAQHAAGQPFVLAVVQPDGSELRMHPGPGASNDDEFTWVDERSIVYAGKVGLVRLNLETGATRRLTSFGRMPAVSPDGSRIAFVGGSECRDRLGIYLTTTRGGQPTRVTNDCRIVGSNGNDTLRGTGLADILVGLAGDDSLTAVDPGYMRDTLLGGDGDDLLVGAVRGEVLKGGHGSDRLVGGNSGDLLDGGHGRDQMLGGRGNDTFYARDGERDVLTCGTTPPWRRAERDQVWADRVDRVSKDCEVVRRPP